MTLNDAFSKRIMELLYKNNMSKYRLEKESGITHSTLRNICNSNNKDVTLSTVAKVANTLNMTLAEFFSHEVFNLANIDYE